MVHSQPSDGTTSLHVDVSIATGLTMSHSCPPGKGNTFRQAVRLRHGSRRGAVRPGIYKRMRTSRVRHFLEAHVSVWNLRLWTCSKLSRLFFQSTWLSQKDHYLSGLLTHGLGRLCIDVRRVMCSCKRARMPTRVCDILHSDEERAWSPLLVR